MMMEVWYYLNDRVDSVIVASDANIARLRDAIKAKSASSLKDVDPIMIDIYASGTTSLEPENVIDPGDPVPARTTSKNPLIVVAPAPQQQQQQLQQQPQPSQTLGQMTSSNSGISTPLAIHLSNKLEKQQHEDDDNILGQGVYEKLTGAVCFFLDEGNKPIGAGFAISETTVYSVAHNFPQVAVGTEISCHFGKPNQHHIRQLRISAVDRRLDYCILRTVQGEAPLPNFLETSTAPLQTGKNCILAAFQIGLQDDLSYLDPELSVGVFKGEISKLYPRHFVYQCPSFAGDSGGAVVLKNGRVIGIHQETVIQARERIQHGADLDTDARLESVEASIDDLLRCLSSGSIGLQLSAIPNPR